jgi:WD40 repeat protein
VIGDSNGALKFYDSLSYAFNSSIQGHSNSISRIKQSPFQILDSGKNYVATISSDSNVRVWNVVSANNWQLLRTYAHPTLVQGIAWLDKDTLASSSYAELKIRIWSVSTGQTKSTITTESDVYSLHLLANQTLLAASVESNINIYNLKTSALVLSIKGKTYRIWDLLQLRKSDLLASARGDATIRIYNMTTSSVLFVLRGHTDQVTCLKQINADTLASGSLDATVRLWNILTGELLRTLTGHTNAIASTLDLGSYGLMLLSGSADKTIKIWKWETGELTNTISTGSAIQSLAVVNQGKHSFQKQSNYK